MRKLIGVPHVLRIPFTSPFLGIANQMREISVLFTDRTLGITVTRSAVPDYPAVVGAINGGPGAGVVCVGDIVSKVNGDPASNMAFEELVASIQSAPRFLCVCVCARVPPIMA